MEKDQLLAIFEEELNENEERIEGYLNELLENLNDEIRNFDEIPDPKNVEKFINNHKGDLDPYEKFLLFLIRYRKLLPSVLEDHIKRLKKGENPDNVFYSYHKRTMELRLKALKKFDDFDKLMAEVNHMNLDKKDFNPNHLLYKEIKEIKEFIER
jgi:hypothetical protein